MKTEHFNYSLPDELIAQHPLPSRSDSRLMVVPRNIHHTITHHSFRDVIHFIAPNDLLIFNDTKVIPARLMGYKSTGGRVECLVERILNVTDVFMHVRSHKTLRIGSRIYFAEEVSATVLHREGSLWIFQFEQPVLPLLNRYGDIPLPPYIKRIVENSDRERYQTLFAQKEGAVAAPTAGLHFDEALIRALRQKDILTTTVTLHIGAGTFQPVRSLCLTEHRMHSEWMDVSEAACVEVNRCRERGGRVIAVGTTVMRCLETASRTGELKPYTGETNLFIYPGFTFHCVDALITNFHLPKSTLLMLVCAFGGSERILRAYEEAVKSRYRFFSYGDAMFLI